MEHGISRKCEMIEEDVRLLEGSNYLEDVRLLEGCQTTLRVKLLGGCQTTWRMSNHLEDVKIFGRYTSDKNILVIQTN